MLFGYTSVLLLSVYVALCLVFWCFALRVGCGLLCCWLLCVCVSLWFDVFASVWCAFEVVCCSVIWYWYYLVWVDVIVTRVCCLR